jgi:hypothetical protein
MTGLSPLLPTFYTRCMFCALLVILTTARTMGVNRNVHSRRACGFALSHVKCELGFQCCQDRKIYKKGVDIGRIRTAPRFGMRDGWSKLTAQVRFIDCHSAPSEGIGKVSAEELPEKAIIPFIGNGQHINARCVVLYIRPFCFVRCSAFVACVVCAPQGCATLLK